MRQVTIRMLAAMLTFAFGIGAATWWSLNYFHRNDQTDTPTSTRMNHPTEGEEEGHPQLAKVSMEGRATFYIPRGMEPRIFNTSIPYRAFRRDGMEVAMFLARVGAGAVCIHHSDENLRRYKISRTKVADREATIGHVEDAAFSLEDYEPLKGITVCVPSIGDGEHEFMIQARYKTEQDYQDIIQTINSIRFH